MKATKDAEIAAIFGARGMGKSTLRRELEAPWSRLVVFDPSGESSRDRRYRGVATLKDMAAAMSASPGAFRLAYTPPDGNEAQALHHVCELLFQLQAPYYDNRKGASKVCLVVEEMDTSYPPSPPAKLWGFKKAILQGRHYGLELVGVTQRPSEIAARFRSNSAATYIFAMSDHTDYEAVRKKVGPEIIPRLRGLARGEYCAWSMGQVSWHTTRP